MKIVSLAPLGGPALERIRALGTLELDPWIDHVPIKLHAADELRARLEGVEALIVEADHVSREVIEGSSLRLLGVCRGDPNNVDLAAAATAGVTVVRTPGRNAGGVADLTVGLIIGLLRGIVAADADVRAGRWVVDGRIAQQRYLGREVSSVTAGLVGCGAVGRAAAARLNALGATVLGYDAALPAADLRALSIEPVRDLGELVARADVVSIHAPLLPATRGLVGEAELSRARAGTFLVNTARYGIVEEGALLTALADGRLAGAAFDHFENEFLPPDHPLVGMPNVILTPHIGGTTRETVATHTAIIAGGFEAALAGRPHPAIVTAP
ncbi:MAG TPA: NAD(P)-dependent oxidoreductase [Actinomycetota bacterium]